MHKSFLRQHLFLLSCHDSKTFTLKLQIKQHGFAWDATCSHYTGSGWQLAEFCFFFNVCTSYRTVKTTNYSFLFRSFFLFFLFLHNYRRSRADVNRYGVVKGLGHCSIFKSFLSEIRLNTVSAGKEQSVWGGIENPRLVQRGEITYQEIEVLLRDGTEREHESSN